MPVNALRKLPCFAFFALGSLALGGCKQPANPVAPPPKDLVAWVNKIPLTEVDLRQRSRGHGADFVGPPRAALLDQLIHDELLAQQALSLGLDNDPQFSERIRRAEAQYRAMRRKELADIYFRREIVDKVQVTEADVKRFYAANENNLRASIHVLQLLFRDEGLAKKALSEIKGGTPFESVAAKQFAVLPEGAQKPWDLGYLAWRQVPAVWRTTVFSMKPGEISEVIAGENQRYWILKLVNRRDDAAVTFEKLKTSLEDELKSARIVSERMRIAMELRKKADIKLEQPVSKPAVNDPSP